MLPANSPVRSIGCRDAARPAALRGTGAAGSNRARRFTRALLLFAGLLPAAGAAGQTITDLGTLGGSASFARGVNQDGSVVVGHSYIPGGNDVNQHAFRWTSGGGLLDIGQLAGGTHAFALAVDASGNVVVGYGDTTGGFGDHAFRWTSGGLQDLGTFGLSSAAAGVSADGAVAAGASSSLFSGTALFRWTSGGGLQNLGGSLLGAAGYGISGDGSTVFGAMTAVLNTAAVYWTQPTGLQGLPSLPGGNNAAAQAANWDGTVLVGRSNTTLDFFTHAVRWSGGAIEDIGLSPTGQSARATAVTLDGNAVVGDSADDASNDAWIWTPTRGMLLLSSYLAGEGVDLSGWTALQTCTGISGDATALVGAGTHLGQTHAFIVRGLRPICGPWILDPPTSSVACAGSSPALAVTAFGPTFHIPVFHWYKLIGFSWVQLTDGPTGFGTVISGASSPTLSFGNTALDSNGYYVCEITGGCGTIVTSPVQVSIIAGLPGFADPGDVAPPTACSHGAATMYAYPGPASLGPFVLQWQRETAPLSNVWVDLANGPTTTWDGNMSGVGGSVSGATTAALTIAADTANGRQLALVHARRYRCLATNVCGTSADLPQQLTVILVGDANCSGSINNFDIDPYVIFVFNSGAALAPPSYLALGNTQACWDQRGCWADLNHDLLANNFDIDPFVACIFNAPPPGKPCP